MVLVQAINVSLLTLEQRNTLLQAMVAHRYQSPVTDLDLGVEDSGRAATYPWHSASCTFSIHSGISIPCGHLVKHSPQAWHMLARSSSFSQP
jgi:hypothetical protein